MKIREFHAENSGHVQCMVHFEPHLGTVPKVPWPCFLATFHHPMTIRLVSQESKIPGRLRVHEPTPHHHWQWLQWRCGSVPEQKEDCGGAKSRDTWQFQGSLGGAKSCVKTLRGMIQVQICQTAMSVCKCDLPLPCTCFHCFLDSLTQMSTTQQLAI